MPALPAFTFMGLRGAAAWLALGAAGVGGYYVATRVMPGVVGGRQAGGGGAAAPAGIDPRTFDLVSNLARALAESSGRVALGSFGPAATIATQGLRLGSDVVETLGRASERQTAALSDVTRESVRANTRAAEGILDLLREERAAPSRTTSGTTLGGEAPPTTGAVAPARPAPQPRFEAPQQPVVAPPAAARPTEIVVGGAPHRPVTVSVGGERATAEEVRIAPSSSFFESLPSWHPRSSSFDVKAWEAAGRPTGI